MRDSNLLRVGVVVVVVVCRHFFKTFTMGFLLNAIRLKFGMVLWYDSLQLNFLKN